MYTMSALAKISRDTIYLYLLVHYLEFYVLVYTSINVFKQEKTLKCLSTPTVTAVPTVAVTVPIVVSKPTVAKETSSNRRRSSQGQLSTFKPPGKMLIVVRCIMQV